MRETANQIRNIRNNILNKGNIVEKPQTFDTL